MNHDVGSGCCGGRIIRRIWGLIYKWWKDNISLESIPGLTGLSFDRRKMRRKMIIFHFSRQVYTMFHTKTIIQSRKFFFFELLDYAWSNDVGFGEIMLHLILGWPKKYQMCWTFRDQCFSHLFYLVISENGQKVQKKCRLRVPNGTLWKWPCYRGISA